jgi:DNA-binding Lrp family transcriptional regulator
MEKTKAKILSYLKTKGQVSPAELSVFLNINRQATHRQIKRLLDSGIISKVGKSPKVFYSLAEIKKNITDIAIDNKSRKIINENFLLITPIGERKEGVEAFIEWCQKRNESIEKTAKEYIGSLKKYAKYRKSGLINGDYKMRHTFKEVFIDKTFYLDFYSIERFGKTKLGQLLLYAKQSQNQNLINELVEKIRPKINSVIKKYKIKAVGFIPPTVKREIQLMKEIEKKLKLTLPTISLVKIKTTVTVPQKTLNKLEDRVENAKNTIILDEDREHNSLLLVDDALGSGATLNETARKIKKQNPDCKIIGLAITGSFSGFEVISEV